MREIKFRAWNTVTKTMIDLKKLTPLALSEGIDGLFLPFRDTLILMQFTGLKDKNQKEIFEGDIVSTPAGHTCIVRWDYVFERTDRWDFKYLGFCFHHIEQVKNYHLDFTTSCDVIGNIYENPELLKQ